MAFLLDNRLRRRDIAVLALGGYALHFTWEMAQAPLFATMKELPFWTATAWCARAAGWDVVISAAAYVCPAFAVRNALWVRRCTALGYAVYFAFGLLVAILIERWAVGSGRWRYDEAMPAIAGIGVTPLAQWVIVPAVIAWLARWRAQPLRSR
jgi:hypothetical protein